MFSLARDGLLGIKGQDCKSRPFDPQRERHNTLIRDVRWIKSLVLSEHLWTAIKTSELQWL
jgi:hypothetical protein